MDFSVWLHHRFFHSVINILNIISVLRRRKTRKLIFCVSFRSETNNWDRERVGDLCCLTAFGWRRCSWPLVGSLKTMVKQLLIKWGCFTSERRFPILLSSQNPTSSSRSSHASENPQAVMVETRQTTRTVDDKWAVLSSMVVGYAANLKHQTWLSIPEFLNSFKMRKKML